MQLKRRIDYTIIVFTLFFILSLLNQVFHLIFLGEIAGIISVIYILKCIIINKKIYFFEIKMLSIMFFIMTIGIYGNILFQVDRSIKVILVDIFSFFKVYICFLATDNYMKKISNYKKLCILKNLYNFSRIFIMIASILYIINLYYDLGLSFDIRYGIPAYKFIYNSSGWLNQYWIGIVLIISMRKIVNKSREDTGYIFCIMMLIIWLSTLRSRAFVMIFFYIFLHIYFKYFISIKLFEKIKENIFEIKKIVIFIFISIILGYNQIVKYYFNNESLKGRNLLLKNSLLIMKEYFPLGAGFGTYGTESAKIEYSPLYYKYMMNLHPALNEKRGTELTDCYWPAVLGETGIIGFILMGILIYILFKYWIKSSKNLVTLKVIILYIIYLVISSSATGIFFSDLTATYMMLIALFINIKIKNNFMEEVNGNNSVI